VRSSPHEVPGIKAVDQRTLSTAPLESGPWTRLLGRTGASLLSLWCLTWRKRSHGLEILDALLDGGEKTLLLFWHGKYPPLFPLFRGRKVCVLTNRSFRGLVIGQVGRHFGYHSVHLPEEPGKRYLFALREALEEHTLWGTAADGPTGPRHRMNPSTLELAARFGFTLLPVGVAGRRCWRFKRRWDKMEIPLPFTLVGLVIGEPLRPPPDLDRTTSPEWVVRLRKALDICNREAEELTRPD